MATTHHGHHQRKVSLTNPSSYINMFAPRKRSVSSPFSPRLRHSRVPSKSSLNHTPGAPEVVLTTSEMEMRATTLTQALLTDQGWDRAAKFLTDELTKRLESSDSRDEHLASEHGPRMGRESEDESEQEDHGTFMLKDAAVDERQRKVWVVAERYRNENKATQWTEMMSFDNEGRVCEIEGWGRPIRIDTE